MTWFIFPPQMFFCFLSHTPIVQLIKENIAVDFFGEAFAGCEICEQDCRSPWEKRGKQLVLVFTVTLVSGVSVPSNLQPVSFGVPHTLKGLKGINSTAFMIQAHR